MQNFYNNHFKYSFIYQSEGYLPYVFRMMIQLDSDIRKKDLRKALDNAYTRYPYLCVKVIENDKGRYEIAHNEKPIVITHGKDVHTLGSDEVNGHYISIGYDKKIIYIDVYHNLTDGTGIYNFVKTLLYYYISYKNEVFLDPDGVNLVTDKIDDREFLDPYERIDSFPESSLYNHNTDKVLCLGDYNNTGKNTIYRIEANEKELIKYAKSNDGTPNALISAVFFKAITKCHPDIKLPVGVGIFANDRPACNSVGTFQNQTSFINLRYPPKIKDMDISSLNTIARGTIILQTQPESILWDVKEYLDFADCVKAEPNRKIRQQMYTDRLEHIYENNTFWISYVGKPDWVNLNPYIKKIDVTIPMPKGGFVVEIASTDNHFDLCISQNFENDMYVKKFMECLDEINVSYKYLGSEEQLLPGVKNLFEFL